MMSSVIDSWFIFKTALQDLEIDWNVSTGTAHQAWRAYKPVYDASYYCLCKM